eukprot:6212241-Pleurochrysis_carterae.AAC.5
MRSPGTKTLNAPGERELRPRLTPTQARESMRDLSTAGLGLTANALHPKGMMPRMEGFSPVTISNDVWLPPGGVDVRLRISTACWTAKSQ